MAKATWIFLNCLLICCFTSIVTTMTPSSFNYKHDSEKPHSEEEIFLKGLFNKYGENGLMTFEGFEHLLQSLGIGNVNIHDHDLRAHRTNGSFVSFHGDHNHSDTEHVGHSDHGHDRDHGDHREDNHHDLDRDHSTVDQKRDYINHDQDKDHSTHDQDNDHGNQGQEGYHQDHAKDYTDHEHTKEHSDRPNEPVTHASNHQDYDNLRRDPNRDLTSHDRDHEHNNLDVDLKGEHSQNLTHHHRHHNHRHNSTSSALSKHRKHHAKKNETSRTDKLDTLVPPEVMVFTTVLPKDNFEMKKGEARVRRTVSMEEKHHVGSGDAVDHHGVEDITDSNALGKAKSEVLLLNKDQGASGGSRGRTCMSAGEILSAFHIRYEEGITQQTFLNLCPAIVYQIDRHACHGPNEGPVIKRHGRPEAYADPKVWGYALASVTVISLVGLLCVALVPILQKAFYQHLIQLLVALAVGSLTGDAMLHLIPHALGTGHEDEGEDHDHSSEISANDPVWKGMMVLGGIYFFFMMERGMAGYQQWRDSRRTKAQFPKKRPRRRSSLDRPRRQSWRFSAIGAKLSEYDLVAYSHENMAKLDKREAKFIEETFELTENRDVSHSGHNDQGHSPSEDKGQGHSHGDHKGHGHSHGGGPIPSSVASIAWMVIAGDGLHNFSDGLAIGAGFANSLTGGLSTSVAVICHELPHELGDFAVLLQSGMTVRQALFYNIVSSVLCFLGMAIGVAVGNIGQASLWIFAMTAGTFIYISLVDMLPELNTDGASTTSSKVCMVLLQLIGVAIGVGIMLVIALFEDKIKIDSFS